MQIIPQNTLPIAMAIVWKWPRLSRFSIPSTLVPCNQLRARADDIELHPSGAPFLASVALGICKHLAAQVTALVADVNGKHAEPGAFVIELAHGIVGYEGVVWVGGDQERTVRLGDPGFDAGYVYNVNAGMVRGEEHLVGRVVAEGRVDEALEWDCVFYCCEAEVDTVSGHVRRLRELPDVERGRRKSGMYVV